MKEKLLAFLLITLSYPTYAQVQKWENWQSDLTISDGNAVTSPASRNVGLNLWPDRGFGQELHFRNNTWGTALYTRSSYEAIWLGNYNSDETQQQNFNPWMTLIGGKVGIGTTLPGSTLTVNGTIEGANGLKIMPFNCCGYGAWIDIPTSGASGIGSGGAGANAWIAYASEAGQWFANATQGDVVYRNTNGKLLFGNTPYNAAMAICNDKIGIGTTTPSEKLSVNGTILAKKIKVLATSAEWPDYVFSRSYKLRPLAELELFIKLKNHLPDVPSAKDIEKNSVDIGATQAILLRKIEELTLYVIEQEKKIRHLERQSTNKFKR